LVYTKGKNDRVIMEFEVLKRHILRPIIVWSNNFAVGEAKEVL
jgi:hypothetical protein